MTRPILERFRQEFVSYFEDYVIAAEFDHSENLVVFTNPYIRFDEVVIQICEGLFETLSFQQKFALYLFPFGSNGYIKLSVNER